MSHETQASRYTGIGIVEFNTSKRDTRPYIPYTLYRRYSVR